MISRHTVRIAAVLFVTLLAGCSTPDTATQTIPISTTAPVDTLVTDATPASTVTAAQNGTANLPPVASSVSWDITRSLDTAVAQAEFIVVGEFIGLGKVFNAARDNSNPQKEALNQYDVTQEYIFRVDAYLKGSAGNKLIIEQVEGSIQSPPSKVTLADIKRAREAYGAMKVEKNFTYLLLLNTSTEVSGTVHYGGNSEPWRFVISEDGIGGVYAPGSVTLSLPEDFIPQPDAPLIPQIEQIVRQQATAP